MYGLTVITPPSAEPVALDQARAHLRVDHTADDDLIAGLIRAARQMTESHTGRRWVTQKLRLTLSGWPCGEIRLPVEPVASVESLTYFDQGGTETAIADFQAWLDHSPPLVRPAPLGYWPALQVGRMAPVALEFTAGGAVADVPDMVRSAILLTVGYWYENRGDGVDPTMMAGLPQALGMPPAAKSLLNLLWNGAYG